MKKGVKLTVTVAVAVAAITVATWMLACGDCLRDASVSGRALWPSVLSFGSGSTDAPLPLPAPTVAPGDASPRSLEGIEEALFVNGSLRGTEYPAWGTVRGEQVKPNRALRDRFDYYLLALNEASLAELSAMVQAHATRDLGPGAAAEIRAVWDRYLQLQQYPFQQVAKPDDLGSMQTALQEHQQVRQRILGVHWAQAFYGDEEQALAGALQQGQSGAPAKADAEHALLQPPPGTDPNLLHQQRSLHFGAEAAQRLRKLDEEDIAWERRIAQARASLGTLQRDPGYSPAQREEAIQRYLDGAFPDANEQLRARGLTGQ